MIELKEITTKKGMKAFVKFPFVPPIINDEIENLEKREKPASVVDLLNSLLDNQVLYRPEYIKLSITTSSNGTINIAACGKVITTLLGSTLCQEKMIFWLNQNSKISMEDINNFIDNPNDQDELLKIITHLYNQNILHFEDCDVSQ